MVPTPTLILRFTHIDNLATLIQRGGLHSPNTMPKDNLPYRSTHSTTVQSARANVAIPCGQGGNVHDYVPFYFGYLSPMMLNLKTGRVSGYTEGQDPLIYCVTDAQTVAGANLPYVFSDGHGLARFTNWFDDLNQLDNVDWNMVYQQYWRDNPDDPDRQRRKQAEFLIHDVCPWSVIKEIAVINEQMKRQVEEILASVPVSAQKQVAIRRQWYYN
jgi:hypothetical protein